MYLEEEYHCISAVSLHCAHERREAIGVLSVYVRSEVQKESKRGDLAVGGSHM